MPRDPINHKHIPLLWGKAAGCCELCSNPVYEEGLLRQEGNYSNIAHINAGLVPVGQDMTRSKRHKSVER